MKYQKIETCNLGNGLGFRVVLWVSGCNHHCPGCQNPETWDPKSGKLFTIKQQQQILEYLNYDYIQGITLSGGDPLMEYNLKTLTSLLKEIKTKLPNKDVWCYTGSLFENVKDLEIMNYIDVLIDGPFILEKRDISLAFRGSTNQRVIDVKQSKAKGEIICL